MSDSTSISFGTYVTSGTVLRAGHHIANGKKVDITPDHIRKIVRNIKSPINLFDRHNGDVVGKIMKVVPNSDYSEVAFTSLITDTERYHNTILKGHDKISPDITVYTDDNDNVVDIVMFGASMTNDPGMNFDSVTAKTLEFQANPVTDTPAPVTDTPANTLTSDQIVSTIQNTIKDIMTGNDWTPPVGDNTPSTNESSPADQVEPSVEQSPGAVNSPSAVDMDALAALINKTIDAKFAQINQTKASEEKQQEIKSMADGDNPQVSKEILEDYAKAIAERDQYRIEVEKAQQRELDAELSTCRKIGIKNPEQYINDVNLTFDQKKTLLANIKERFAITTPINKPMSHPMSATPDPKTTITVDKVAAYLGGTTDEFRKKLAELDIFDKNGKFINR